MQLRQCAAVRSHCAGKLLCGRSMQLRLRPLSLCLSGVDGSQAEETMNYVYYICRIAHLARCDVPTCDSDSDHKSPMAMAMAMVEARDREIPIPIPTRASRNRNRNKAPVWLWLVANQAEFTQFCLVFGVVGAE